MMFRTWISIKCAATHPEAPYLPKGAFTSEADVNAALKKELDALTWVVENFASENPGTQIVSKKDLLNVTPPCFGFRLSTDNCESPSRR